MKRVRAKLARPGVAVDMEAAAVAMAGAVAVVVVAAVTVAAIVVRVERDRGVTLPRLCCSSLTKFHRMKRLQRRDHPMYC